MSTENTDLDDKIAAAVEAALAKANSDIEKLKAKNQELLTEKRAAKAAADEAAERAEEAQELAARAANDTTALEKTLAAKYQKQLDAATAKATAADATLQKLLVDNGITQALQQANVAPSLAKAAAALLRSEASIDITDGAAMINGVALSDYVANWAKTDGKDFVAAPVNGGGGSLGASAGAAVGAWTAENFHSKTTEFMALAKTNPAEAKRIAISVGQTAVADSIN